MMPGGSPTAWPHVKDIFQSIAAKVEDGAPCCDWVGENGAGHYVKMVHNGIEYGDMELICEAYNLMKTGLGLGAEAMQPGLRRVEPGRTRFLPHRNHRETSSPSKTPTARRWWTRYSMPPGRKGTGKWMVISSLELGIPITLIAEAVYSRCISALKEERVAAARQAQGTAPPIPGDPTKFIEDIRRALYASKIISYAQGYMLLRAAARQYHWNLNYGGDCPDVARRVHHSQRVPGQDQGGLRPRTRA